MSAIGQPGRDTQERDIAFFRAKIRARKQAMRRELLTGKTRLV